jgi:hypothetical protein
MLPCLMAAAADTSDGRAMTAAPMAPERSPSSAAITAGFGLYFGLRSLITPPKVIVDGQIQVMLDGF